MCLSSLEVPCACRRFALCQASPRGVLSFCRSRFGIVHLVAAGSVPFCRAPLRQQLRRVDLRGRRGPPHFLRGFVLASEERTRLPMARCGSLVAVPPYLGRGGGHPPGLAA